MYIYIYEHMHTVRVFEIILSLYIFDALAVFSFGEHELRKPSEPWHCFLSVLVFPRGSITTHIGLTLGDIFP